MTLNHLVQLREESARFVAVLGDTPGDVGVPTCPDWTADDLLWHLASVQWFWGVIVRDAVADPEEVERPPRPSSRTGLLTFFEEATSLLGSALADTEPSEHRWTWAEDQTAGFIRRRQAHEALIHRIDAELTAGVDRADIDIELATDGIDEVLQVMYGGAPPWARAVLDADATVLIRSLDVDRAWLVTLGTFSGTSPGGNTYEDDHWIEVADAAAQQAAAAGVVATSAELDLWLWRRSTVESIERSGDQSVLDRFESIIADGID